MNKDNKSIVYFKNRHKTREALLCVLYAYEMNEITLEQLTESIEPFFTLMDESRENSTVELLKDQLETIFDDVRHKKLEAEDQISFILPKNSTIVNIKYSELESCYWHDGFSEYCAKFDNLATESTISDQSDKEADDQNVNANKAYFTKSLHLYTDKNEDLDQLIKEKLQNWDFGRVAVIDKVIIRMGIIELLNFNDIPSLVTVNEAIELGKKYSTDNSGKFINGLLHAFIPAKDQQVSTTPRLS